MALKTTTITKVSVELDGIEYEGEVELSKAQLDALSKKIDAFEEAEKVYLKARVDAVGALEKAGLEPVKKTAPVSEAKKIRTWAKRTGVEVNAQGAIPGPIREQYLKAKAAGELEADEK